MARPGGSNCSPLKKFLRSANRLVNIVCNKFEFRTLIRNIKNHNVMINGGSTHFSSNFFIPPIKENVFNFLANENLSLWSIEMVIS